MPDGSDPLPVIPSRILRVDTDRLRAIGGSMTNAQRTAESDRAVTGTHDFLIVAVDATTHMCTALPLYPRSAPGSAQLDAALLEGEADFTRVPVFYSRWQHWRIPVDALSSASESDDPGRASRRYAAGQADVLRDLANWASRNRCDFRPA